MGISVSTKTSLTGYRSTEKRRAVTNLCGMRGSTALDSQYFIAQYDFLVSVLNTECRARVRESVCGGVKAEGVESDTGVQ